MSLLGSFAGILQQQGGGGGGGFNPQTAFSWHSLFWAEGSQFEALGTADAATVETWPNETAETDATQSTGTARATYRASVAKFNSKPAMDFDGGDNYVVSSFSSNPTYPLSVVVIGAFDSASATNFFFDGSGASNRTAGYIQSTSYRITQGGTVRTGGTPNTNARLHLYRFDTGGSDRLNLDGSGTATIDFDAGSHTIAGLMIGANITPASYLAGEIAMIGLYQGDISAHGSWGDFKTWITSHYGITTV
jgi:hypothetical protein